MAAIAEVENSYTFRTDTETGTTAASGGLQNSPVTWNSAARRAVGGAARLPTDHGGHLVAARFNGPSTRELAPIQETADLQYLDIREASEAPSGPSIPDTPATEAGPGNETTSPDLTGDGSLPTSDNGSLDGDDSGGLNDDD